MLETFIVFAAGLVLGAAAATIVIAVLVGRASTAAFAGVVAGLLLMLDRVEHVAYNNGASEREIESGYHAALRNDRVPAHLAEWYDDNWRPGNRSDLEDALEI